MTNRICSAKYLGKTMCGFTTNEEYNIKITHDLYGYFIEDMDSMAAITYASEISIRRNWSLPEE